MFPPSDHFQQIGAVGTPTPQSLANALKAAGFRLLQSNNASIDGLQAPLIEKADGYFRRARKAILAAVRVGLLPQHFKTLLNRLTKDCDAFIEADRARLITTSYHWLAEKPLDAVLPHHDDSGLGSLAGSREAVTSASPVVDGRTLTP
jgi:sterol 24-C-methyltransferase